MDDLATQSQGMPFVLLLNHFTSTPLWARSGAPLAGFEVLARLSNALMHAGASAYSPGKQHTLRAWTSSSGLATIGTTRLEAFLLPVQPMIVVASRRLWHCPLFLVFRVYTFMQFELILSAVCG